MTKEVLKSLLQSAIDIINDLLEQEGSEYFSDKTLENIVRFVENCES